MTPAELFISRLDKVMNTGPNRWQACCPAHQDLSPSLSIKELPDTRLLIHCHAGCGAADVVAALGLNLSDLYPPDENYSPVRKQENARTEAEWVVEIAQQMVKEGRPFTEKDKKRVMEAMKQVQGVAA